MSEEGTVWTRWPVPAEDDLTDFAAEIADQVQSFLIALREIARCFLAGAGLTVPGELAKVTGLSRPDAGRGNRALVAEGYARMLAPGRYQLAASPG